jgi:hypothetical protein
MSEAEKIKAQLVIVTGLVVLYFVFKSPYFLYAAAGIVCIALPVVGDFIVKVWYKIAEVLGWVNSRVILSVVFFCGLYQCYINSLQTKRPDGKSVFYERNHTYTKKDLENIW